MGIRNFGPNFRNTADYYSNCDIVASDCGNNCYNGIAVLDKQKFAIKRNCHSRIAVLKVRKDGLMKKSGLAHLWELYYETRMTFYSMPALRDLQFKYKSVGTARSTI